MPRGRKRTESAAKPSKARERSQSAARVVNKNPRYHAPEAARPRRSSRIRDLNSTPHSKGKSQLSQQESQEISTRSLAGAATVPGLQGETARPKVAKKKRKPTAKQNQTSSNPKTESKPKRRVTAERDHQSEQDPTYQVQPPRKGAKRVETKRSGPAARKPTTKTAQRKAKSSEPAVVSLDSAPGDESGRHGPRGGSDSLDDNQALQLEGLEELSLRFGLVGAARDEELTDTSEQTYTDPREHFNHKYGYLPPLSEEASYIIAAIMENPALAKRMARISPDSKALFRNGLTQRNVEMEPSETLDPHSEKVMSLSLGEFLRETIEQKEFCERLWLRDRARLTTDSSEAIFQRTLMVSLIARHIMIYENKINGEQLFDFSAEEPWSCLPMPSQALWKATPGSDIDEKLLTQPKPDLAVCFKRKAIINNGLWNCLPQATKELACFENQNSGISRIFHFLAVEAKNATTSLEDQKALYQSLNNASQALNNFYEFFQDAGPLHRQIFFEKVRFFSVVANTKGILIRIHRATELPDDVRHLELVMPNRTEYRLKFEYQEFARLVDKAFTRERVIEIFRKMLKYAVDGLSVWITAAAKDLVNKLDMNDADFQARTEISFYRHGQPYPKTSRNTPKTSRAASQSGRASPLAEQMFNARLHSATQSMTEEASNGQITPKANYSQQNSQLSNGSSKRSMTQAQIEFSDGEELQVTGKRLRKAKRKQGL